MAELIVYLFIASFIAILLAPIAVLTMMSWATLEAVMQSWRGRGEDLDSE
jgi:hypothetical protein